MIMRLDKYLAEMGVGSRQEVKQIIRKGLVTVDGSVERKPESKIQAGIQAICCENRSIAYAQYEYYMLHKPAGIISASEGGTEPTVVDLITGRKRKDLFPAGRLDKDTEGLLLITNDGMLAHRLLSPNRHVDKVYYARIDGTVTFETIRLFREGIDIGIDKEEITRPADLELVESNAESVVRLTIREGKYHQVKRMFEAVGMHVLYLKREQMGTLVLDETLKPGEYRELTEKELEQLQ